LAGRAPDLMFVGTDRLELVRDQFLDGPADLVIEVISPDTERIDRRDKFAEYQQGGVPEYWILEPHTEVADFYVRDQAGLFQREETPDGRFLSSVIRGLRIKVEWLWERPRIDKVLLELGLGR
ncbi:MAG: Uma2 family endonuclease, partial [Anaerolineaceae bacterium]